MTESSIAEKIREKKKAFLAREQEIVESAKSLLIDHHVDKITVAEIAKKASIGKGTIYKHFQTKNEILVRIMLDYEKGISVELKKGLDRAKEGDPGAVSKAYFESRLANPADDRLVQKLEDKLADAEDVKEQMMQFYQIRRSHEESLKSVVSDLIKKGILENVPPHFHYLSCWALAQGAIELFFNKTWGDLDDMPDLLGYITSIGVTMGNKGQYHLKGDKKPFANNE
ncbi:MAG: TetR/AcrR family transcriptional regulator [Pseudomonadota bacterium]|nr:TetR/AcrR family transcriptional regulator [Pseudomonadota bacterium]MED6344494.1 TetR/AcrR family transcriptional regulator [Pseudomonadota bacterium]